MALMQVRTSPHEVDSPDPLRACGQVLRRMLLLYALATTFGGAALAVGSSKRRRVLSASGTAPNDLRVQLLVQLYRCVAPPTRSASSSKTSTQPVSSSSAQPVSSFSTQPVS